MEQVHDIAVGTDGTLSFIYADDLHDLLDLGDASVRRASNVEPDPANAGQWLADMSPVAEGVTLGPFKLRGDALAAEVAYIRENVL